MADEVATVTLSVPAEAAYARSVRMMAANLAVVCGMSVDEVEDVRMAAGEGFVYACATEPASCEISFAVDGGGVSMEFALGAASPEASGLADVDLIELMLEAVCDESILSDDGGSLRLTKRTDVTHGE